MKQPANEKSKHQSAFTPGSVQTPCKVKYMCKTYSLTSNLWLAPTRAKGFMKNSTKLATKCWGFLKDGGVVCLPYCSTPRFMWGLWSKYITKTLKNSANSDCASTDLWAGDTPISPERWVERIQLTPNMSVGFRQMAQEGLWYWAHQRKAAGTISTQHCLKNLQMLSESECL